MQGVQLESEAFRVLALPGRCAMKFYLQASSAYIRTQAEGGPQDLMNPQEIPYFSSDKSIEEIQIMLTVTTRKWLKDLDPLMPNAALRKKDLNPQTWFYRTPAGHINPERVEEAAKAMPLEEFVASAEREDDWAETFRPHMKDAKEKLLHVNAMTAIRNESIYTFAALLQNGCGMNGRCARTHRAALHIICLRGHLKPARWCIQAGAALEIRDINGYTPLHMATARGHVSVIKELLKHGAQPDAQTYEGITPLFQAVVQYTLSKGVDKKWLEIAPNLIRSGANIHLTNNLGDTPARLAARMPEAIDMLQVLTHDTPKPYGIDYKTEDGFSLLMVAAQFGAYPNASYILRQGSEPNHKTKYGDTALSFATKYGMHHLMVLLLENKADPNIPNNLYQTPLFMATHERASKTAEILLVAGANSNIIDQNGNSPICHAIAECGMEANTLRKIAEWYTTPQWMRNDANDFIRRQAPVVVGNGPFPLPDEMKILFMKDVGKK